MADLTNKPVKICNDRVLLKLTKDKLKAVLQLANPDDHFEAIDFPEILKEVQEHGVSFGFFSKLPPARDGKTIIANGKAAVPGENAKVKPVVKPALQFTPKTKEGVKDKVDFRELGNIVNVPAGQLLLQKIAATAGSPGKNVLGAVIATKAGKDVTMKCGSGAVLSDDGMQVLSTLDGKFIMRDGKACVLEEHVVQGDVDMSVGNIAFFGSLLEIQGEVISGFKVKCKGDISVAKGVGNAVLIAGGNLTINGGMVGEEAEVRAKGNIRVDFCENFGLLEARKSLTVTNYLIQGQVKVGEKLTALEGKGKVIGGAFVVGGSMYVKELGSDAEVVTHVTVGLKPELEKRKRKIEVAKQYWPDRMNELLKNISAINEMKKKEGKDFGGEKAKVLAEINDMMPEVMEMNNKLTEMEAELEDELNKAACESVYVYKTLYPGVHINIGSSSLFVNKQDSQVVVELDKKTLKVKVRPMTSEEKEGVGQ